MKKKCLLFLIESMVVGGAERVLINLVNSLSPKKYDITVVSIFKNSVYEGYNCTFTDSLASHVKYKFLINNSNHLIYTIFNVLFNHGWKRLFHWWLIGRGFDVEIAWYEGLPTTFLAHSSNKQSRKLAWLHSGDGFSGLTVQQRERLRREYAVFDQIVGVSNGVCRNFQQHLGEGYPLTTCYNILDNKEILNKADAFAVDREPVLTFVSVGRLIPVKGFVRLIHVCGRLKKEGYDFRLWIIGEGSEHDALQRQIQNEKLEREGLLLGNKDNPYPYMKAADWFISSSYAEGFSTVLTEAGIIGTPIISTRCLGTAEFLGKNNEYGMMVENSEVGMYQAMKQVFAHPEWREDYSNRIRQRSTAFHYEALLKAIEQYL